MFTSTALQLPALWHMSCFHTPRHGLWCSGSRRCRCEDGPRSREHRLWWTFSLWDRSWVRQRVCWKHWCQGVKIENFGGSGLAWPSAPSQCQGSQRDRDDTGGPWGAAKVGWQKDGRDRWRMTGSGGGDIENKNRPPARTGRPHNCLQVCVGGTMLPAKGTKRNEQGLLLHADGNFLCRKKCPYVISGGNCLQRYLYLCHMKQSLA